METRDSRSRRAPRQSIGFLASFSTFSIFHFLPFDFSCRLCFARTAGRAQGARSAGRRGSRRRTIGQRGGPYVHIAEPDGGPSPAQAASGNRDLSRFRARARYGRASSCDACKSHAASDDSVRDGGRLHAARPRPLRRSDPCRDLHGQLRRAPGRYTWCELEPRRKPHPRIPTWSFCDLSLRPIRSRT